MFQRAKNYTTMMRAALSVVALGVGGMFGCILYVDEGASECEGLVCGDNAYCDAGLCNCYPGYGGVAADGCDPVMTVILVDACDDGYDMEFRLFSQDTGTSWPVNSTLFTAGYNVDTYHDIRCRSGERVCLGAEAGGLRWGVGLENDGACTSDLEFECGPYTVDAGYLTCD